MFFAKSSSGVRRLLRRNPPRNNMRWGRFDDFVWFLLANQSLLFKQGSPNKKARRNIHRAALTSFGVSKQFPKNILLKE